MTKVRDAGLSCSLNYDGSAHDSNQHMALIELIDNKLIKAYETRWEAQLSEHTVHSKRIAATAIKLATSSRATVNLRGKKGEVLAKAVIRGTTFSGHPTRTTLGNTLRVYFYNKYYAHIAGIHENDFMQAVHGDDSVMWTRPEHIENLRNAIWNNTSRNSLIPEQVGLGQCVKEITTSAWWDFTFCSKHGWATETSFGLVKLPFETLLKSRWYRGTNASLTSSPAEHRALVAACQENELPEEFKHHLDDRLRALKRVGDIDLWPAPYQAASHKWTLEDHNASRLYQLEPDTTMTPLASLYL